MVSCPNCGSTVIDTKWVFKRNMKDPESFSKYINKILNDRKQEEDTLWITGTSAITSTYTYHKLNEFIQVVVGCKECGYTQVVNPNDWEIADEL